MLGSSSCVRPSRRSRPRPSTMYRTSCCPASFRSA